jgi:response regulator RpfG family c-di-GMP phosphodiesterase
MIFIVSQDPQFHRLTKVTLDLATNHPLYQCQDSQEVLKNIPDDLSKDVLIIYHPPQKDYRIQDLMDLPLKFLGLIKVLIVLDSEKFIKDWQSYMAPAIDLITKEFFLENFNDIITNAFGPLPEDDTNKFQQIDINTLKSFDGLESDVFIRSNVTGHYSALFKKGKKLSVEEINHFVERGLQKVYLPIAIQKQVLRQIEGQMEFFSKLPHFKFVFRAESDPLSKRFERKVIRVQEELYLDKEFKEQIESAIQKTMEFISSRQQLDRLLKVATNIKGKDRYLIEHMMLLSYITSVWSKQLGWHSQGTKDKLIVASIIHDITLGGNPELAEISNIPEFIKTDHKLSEEQLQLLLNHPSDAAQIVRTNFQVSYHDAAEIIAHHHETPDGKGVPKGINHTKMSPLLQLFILAHDFVHEVITKEDFNLDNFLANSLKKYPYQSFKKIVNLLQRQRLELKERKKAQASEKADKT